MKNSKSCKGYCFEKPNSPHITKICNKPNCRNYKRAKKLLKELFEKQLKEVEKSLY